MSDPRKIVTAFIAAVGAKDLDTALDLVTDGVSYENVPIAGFFEVTDEGLISVWRDYFDMSTYARQFTALTSPK